MSVVCCLCEAEAFSTLMNSEQELLPKHFVGRVLRKVNLIETYKKYDQNFAS